MNVKKIANGAVKTVKQNPELALLLFGIVAPKLAKKAAPVIAAVVASKSTA